MLTKLNGGKRNMRGLEIVGRMPRVSRIAMIIGAASVLTMQLFISVLMAAPSHALSTVTINSLTTSGWSTADTRTNGHVALITDTTAPLGAGALSLKTDAAPAPSQDKAQFMTAANVALSDAATQPMYYSTKQNAASFVAGLPSYQVVVNLYGTGGFTTLVYEPYNNEGNAAVHNGEWQQWNVGEGKFWSTRAVGSLQPSQGTYQYTLAQILAEFPNAQVQAIGVNVGSNNPGYDTEVDGLAFNGNLYDFEFAPDAPTGLGFTQAGLVCGGVTNSSNVTLSWNPAAGATGYTYSVTKPNSTTTETTVAATTAAYSFTTEGQYSYKVRANGAGGTQSEWSAPCTVKYDKTAPTVSIGVFSPLSGTVGSTVTFSGTTAGGANMVTVYVGTTNVGTATVNANGSWSLTTTVPAIPAGIYTLKAVASDEAGNTATAQSFFFVFNFIFNYWTF